MSQPDLNVDNYTVPELMAILELDDPTTSEVNDSTNTLIDRFTSEGNQKMASFFQNTQTKLNNYIDAVNSGADPEDLAYDPDNTQTDNWFTNESIPQQNNPVQSNKVTERKQKIDVYTNGHVPMNQNQLGINNNFNVPVAQDVLNPNLENITTRFVNIDSQFRQASDKSSTDYTLDLSDPLTKTVSLRMYSVQIPYTWYVIDTQYGNTCFWIVIPYNGKKYEVQVSITPGNYTYTTFQTEFAAAITAANITNVDPTLSPITINSNNGKVTISLSGWQYTDPVDGVIPITGVSEATAGTFDININPYFVFFDFSAMLQCGYSCDNRAAVINSTLGWVMGFRLPVAPIFSSPGNTPVSIIDLYGPKYFILVLDDFNQNHINNGLITITETSKKLSIPSYYNNSQPYICVPNAPNQVVSALTNVNGADADAIGLNTETAFGLLDKLDSGTGRRQVVLPSAPRTLTNAQLYTINEIIKNREQNTTFRGKAPTNSDTFALIPIKKANIGTGDLYAEFGGTMQDNKRTYFGPVNIDRLRIKLVDDRGYTVDLHGAEWCFTMIAELLYQY